MAKRKGAARVGPRRGGRRDAQQAARWRERVLAWEESGLSQKEFCRRAKVSVHTFRWWRYSLRLLDGRRGNPVGDGDQRPAFVEVTVTPSSPGAAGPRGVVIELPGGPVIRVEPGFDAVALKEVLAILGVGAC